jgi:glutamate/tyrosine decarboxylase-like PLP-dependent enzyme
MDTRPSIREVRRVSALEPPIDEQRQVLGHAVRAVVEHASGVEALPVAPDVTPQALRDVLAAIDVEDPMDETQAVDLCVRLLTDGIVHVTSPSYFGLFNPTPAFMGIVGDLLTAAFNPQLAAWSHAPAAAEIEAWLVRYLAARLGLAEPIAGSFTSGGAEANAQAMHLALTRAFPAFGDRGVRGVDAPPVMYASEQSHDTWFKIAHVCGVGRDAVRLVPVGTDLRMLPEALDETITRDVGQGLRPVLVVATAGTTSAGVIDPLGAAADIAGRHGAWCHVDAAWGGAAALSDALRPHLDGIAAADSVTVDAHKWLSVPMGAGMFITRHPDVLGVTYRISTSYMPAMVEAAVDPYTTSTQWSRRFTGLKLFMTLLTVGRTGYAAQMERDCTNADLLRDRLAGSGWRIVNTTPLPLVCVVDPNRPDDVAHHQRIVDTIVESGRAWLSLTRLQTRPAIRICITSHRTTDQHVAQLCALLDAARQDAVQRREPD